ncbi:antibiotic biosynthesis monooxygenase [Catenulispora pinisilvae]|uniref:antibiotic biosynthesis monooxygenase n=1 Tax=Catenulispora pinisilvae TaxID=2705253 RepID=UPI001890FD53|nr:antibiotic biosynthesis monooxygenase [Catenulispora pinisilvae]
MIIRIWRGWTSPQNADAYEALLREEITGESVNGAQTPGMLGIDVLRHDPDPSDATQACAAKAADTAPEVEFSTIMSFNDWDAVRAFAGAELHAAVVPDADRALLTRWDERSRHYDLLSRDGNWKTLADDQ